MQNETQNVTRENVAKQVNKTINANTINIIQDNVFV